LSDTDTPLSFILLDSDQDPFVCLAELVLDQSIDSAESNPAALEKVTIWCHHSPQIQPIQRALLAASQARGQSALVLPQITTLADWLQQQYPAAKPFINQHDKQLILVDAIRQFPELFQSQNNWAVAKELVMLFDELSWAQLGLDEGESALRSLLSDSYAALDVGSHNISRESKILCTLWNAYQSQIEARGCIDASQYYCSLLTSIDSSTIKTPIYVIARDYISVVERKFFTQLQQHSDLTIVYNKVAQRSRCGRHHPYHRLPGYTEALHSAIPQQQELNDKQVLFQLIFDHSETLITRLQKARDLFIKNPLEDSVYLYETASLEEQILAIVTQSKRWLLTDAQPIAIICDDRQLTRRIRSALEGQGIPISDSGGWAISTTAAASIIQQLLEMLQSGFDEVSVFEFMSSPLFTPVADSAELQASLLATFKALESNVGVKASGMQALMQRIQVISHGLATEDQADTDAILNCLESIRIAVRPLLALLHKDEIAIGASTATLLQALNDLQITERLEQDAAGAQVLFLLQAQALSVQDEDILVTWRDWRLWLHDQFEYEYFVAEKSDPRIHFCTLQRLAYGKYSHLIFAGMDETAYSTSTDQKTFFNQNVRHELGLQTSHQILAIQYMQFRQALEQHQKILICAQTQVGDESKGLQAWVQLLKIFSQQGFHSDLKDNELIRLMQLSQYYEKEKHIADIKSAHAPTSSAPAELLHNHISATQYQTLVNCPYQYLMKHLLHIKQDRKQEKLAGGAYGEAIHQCLYNFHFAHTQEPALSSLSLTEKEKRLEDISKAVFDKLPYASAEVSVWYQRWRHSIPSYVEWLTARNGEWQVDAGEHSFEMKLTERVSLKGQIDRIDRSSDSMSVIDYKTSSNSEQYKKLSIKNGDLVQLPFYGLLCEQAEQASYLVLGHGKKTNTIEISNADEFNHLKQAHHSRLIELVAALQQQQVLPANGSEKICDYCDYEGYCRRSHWQ